MPIDYDYKSFSGVDQLDRIRRNFKIVGEECEKVKDHNVFMRNMYPNKYKDFQKLDELMLKFEKTYWIQDKQQFNLVFEEEKKSPSELVTQLAQQIAHIHMKDPAKPEKGTSKLFLQNLYSSLQDFYKLPNIDEKPTVDEVQNDVSENDRVSGSIFKQSEIDGGGRKFRSTRRRSGARRSFHRRRRHQVASRRRYKQQTGRRRRSTYQTRRRHN